MSSRIALADQLYGGNVESTVLAPLCPNMVIWLKIPKLTWFKLCPSPKKMRHINIDLSMQSNHFSQEMVHEGPFSDTRSPTTKYNLIMYFFKTLKKGEILQSGKGGKLDFDHYFAFLTIFLKR